MSENCNILQDAWWVRISTTTHYNSINMIINNRYMFRLTGGNTLKSIDLNIRTCTVMHLFGSSAWVSVNKQRWRKGDPFRVSV